MTTQLQENTQLANPVMTDAISSLRQVLNDEIRGKEEVIELVLACLLARGHLLLEDLPGLGKTTLARTLAFCRWWSLFTRSVYARLDANRHHWL